jgi:hypothetical protein
MTGLATGFERRVQGALEASPSRIPIIMGGCGTGRTYLLSRLRERADRDAVHYIDVERCATTPERFLEAVTSASPFQWHGRGRTPTSARDAFDAVLAFFDSTRAPGGGPCTFLLDEVFELRTFESFPGLRHVLRDLLEALSGSANRFVLTTRYVARAQRLLRDGSDRFEMMPAPAMSASEIITALAPAFDGYEQMPTDDRDYLSRAVLALTDGRAIYVAALGEAMARFDGPADPVAALTVLLAPGGTLDEWCRSRYELRLHRARGYGALKAILDILAEEESITLTEISNRLHRTPGSTKDYLSWLEDVDLVQSKRKRYSFEDPMLRLWVGLHRHPTPPATDDVVREVQRYAGDRMPHQEPAVAYTGATEEATPEERKNWGIIEID